MNLTPLLLAASLLSSPGDALRVCELRQRSDTAEQLQYRLLADAGDGRLDEFSLLEAALIAGGSVDERELRRLSDRFVDWADTFDASRTKPSSQREIAQDVFEPLHEQFLFGQYHAQCSDPAAALREGDYNCVSATVLYIAALRSAGVSARACATVGHVFCRVGEDEFDVETTCRRWFRLGEGEARAALDRAACPIRRTRGAARPLSDVELLAKLYYNRGVACFRRQAFDEGLRLTRLSLRLDPHDKVARGNELAGMNNWALRLCREEQFADAAELFDALKQLDPEYPTLSENEAHLYRLWDAQRLEHALAAPIVP